jgi:endonuclease-3 related protein
MPSLADIYTLLRQHFGAIHGPEAGSPWWPLYGDDPAFEIIVGAVLVQQTRWEVVESAVLRLLAAGLLAPPALAAVTPDALAALIRPAAFHTQKAPGLIAIARHICQSYGGDTTAMLARPSAELRAELLALPRVGRETCDVIMLYGGGHPLFVVDEYTRRLLERVRQGQPIWRAPYDTLRAHIERELTAAPPGSPPVTHHPSLAALYAEYHALINEGCVRYCLSRPRCDGPPARRVYSRQDGRESYLDRHDGCPLRPVCGFYRSTRSS